MKQAARFWIIVALVLTCGRAGAETQKAKYVFLFIGDGMAAVQRTATEYYLGAVQERLLAEVPYQKLTMNTFPAQGLTTTFSLDDIITESSAAATAMATGYKTRGQMVSMDPNCKYAYKTIVETAKEQGWRVGIVSSASIDHATPACFYAHVRSRENYYEISRQLVESNVDYFGGGQLKGNLPSQRRQKPDLLPYAREKGWTIATNRAELVNLVPGRKTIAYTLCDTSAAMNYAIDHGPNDVSLAEFTRKGIELLYNDKGFFFMVEGGKIDWACHDNDAATAVREVIAFDKAVAEAVEFAVKHPNDTLIVVTGDHETGGMSVGFAATKYTLFPNKLRRQSMSCDAFDKLVAAWRRNNTPFDQVLPKIREIFGFESLSDHETSQLEAACQRSMTPSRQRVRSPQAFIDYGDCEPLTVACTHLLGRQAGIGWTTYAHTASPVITSAMGIGANLFEGHFDNTDIYDKLMAVTDLPRPREPTPAFKPSEPEPETVQETETVAP
jgi:alkaline phosphatase